MQSAKTFTAFLCINLLLFSAAVAQSEIVLKDIKQKFHQFSEGNFSEKIFVHTDRNFYVAGETMWFKIYVADGATHKAVDISKVACLEVLDKAGKAVLQAKVNLEDGIGKGSFYLPLSLRSGNYVVRAYTSWMRNASADYFFQETVTIVNTFLAPSTDSLPVTSGAFDVQFFPEGGQLLEGIESKVAFRAVGQDGKGIDFEGAVINQEGDTIIQFQPLKFGIGHFYLTPSAGSGYQALINTGNDTIAFRFPAAEKKGYTMQVTNIDAKRIEVAVSSAGEESGIVYLLAHTRNEIKFAEAKNQANGKTFFTIDKEALGDGISHFTVFDNEVKPVAERLYFKYPEQNLALDARLDKELYFARQKADLNLSAHMGGEAAESNLSMAVYKLDSLSQENSGNILSCLWLTSDLRGEIESPGYYFEGSEDSGAQPAEAMDNLMLTHGWRKFLWEDVLRAKEPQPEHVPEYEGLIIKGVVQDKITGEPVAGVKTFLSVPGKLLQFYASESNAKGEIFFVTNNFFGPKELFIQTQAGDSLYTITLKDPYSKESPAISLPSFELIAGKQQSLRARHIHMQAQNIYREGQQNKLIAPVLDSVPYWGPADKIYLLDDYTRFPSMEEVMREYVYEVRVRKENGKFKFMVFNPRLDAFYHENPLVLLDGIPVFDIDKIIKYNPLNVESLEVFNGEYSLGADVLFPGILSYTTYKGDLKGFQQDTDLLKVNYEGLQFQREFFSPVYEPDRDKSSRIPDFRNLLFWSPDIKTGKSGQEKISFYTSDLPGQYIVVVQGITKEGKAGYKSITFQVESSL